MSYSTGATDGGDASLLDAVVIDELRELLGEELPIFLAKFRDAAAQQIEAAKAGLARQDWHSVYAAMHTLKGSAGVVGATALTQSCLEFEQRAKVGNLEQGAERLAQVEHLSNAVCERLKCELGG